jgi:DNA-directed RNA polymerase subunit K/omega
MPKKVKEDSDNDEEFEIEEEIIEDEDSDFVSEDDAEEDDDINQQDNKEGDNEEEDIFIDDGREEIEITSEKEALYINKENRISNNRLTKYELVRILGERTNQLTMGAKPLVKNINGLSYEKIAEAELLLNMLPFKIKRPLPNGMFEIWSLDELYKDHLLSQLE